MPEEQKLPVDIHSPEFRNFLYNQFLEHRENVNKLGDLIAQIERIESFDDLTPIRWAQIALSLPMLKNVHAFTANQLAKAGELIDDRELMQRVGELSNNNLKEKE